MTDPVILLGTQSNGETLPVQVDGFGRLVAEGLQGSEGPRGPEGPQGPPGPGGDNLPMDGTEGQVLTWVDGAPTWVGDPPGPEQPPTNIVWSNYVTAENGDGGFEGGRGPAQLFDGNINTNCAPTSAGASIVFTPPVKVVTITSMRIFSLASNNYSYTFDLGGRKVITDCSGSCEWFSCDRFIGMTWNPGMRLEMYETLKRVSPAVCAIEVNGYTLTNPAGWRLARLEARLAHLAQSGIIPTSDIDPS